MADQNSGDNKEEISKSDSLHSQQTFDMRQTPKYNDVQSYVTQSHHSVGTGLFLTDEVYDLPPRYRNKVVRVLETCAAINNIPLPSDPLTFMSSVPSETFKDKDDSDPLVTSSSSQRDKKCFERKRTSSGTSSECDINKQKIPSYNLFHHPNSSNKFHTKGDYISSSQNSSYGKGMNKKDFSTNETAFIHKGGSHNYPVFNHLSLDSNAHLETSQFNPNVHPRYRPLIYPHRRESLQSTVSSSSQNNKNSHDVQSDFAKNRKSFSRTNSTWSHSDESTFSFNSKSSNRNKTARELLEADKRDAFVNNTSRSNKATVTNNYNSPVFTTNQRSNIVSQSGSISDSTSNTIRNKPVKSKNYSDRELNNHNSLRNYNERNSNHENSNTNTNFKAINALKSDSGNTSIYDHTYVNTKLNRNNPSSKPHRGQDLFNNRKFDDKNLSSKPTNTTRESNNFAATDAYLYHNNREENPSKKLSEIEQRNNTEDGKHKDDRNKSSSASSVRSLSQNASSSLNRNTASCDGLRQNKKRNNVSSKSYKDEDVSNCRGSDYHKFSSYNSTSNIKESGNVSGANVHSSHRSRDQKASKKFNGQPIKEQRNNVQDGKYRCDNKGSDFSSFRSTSQDSLDSCSRNSSGYDKNDEFYKKEQRSNAANRKCRGDNKFNNVSSVRSTSRDSSDSLSRNSSSYDDIRQNKKINTTEYKYPHSKKHYDTLSIASDTSVGASSLGKNSLSHGGFHSHERRTASKYSKPNKGPPEKVSSYERKMFSNSENYKQTKPHSNYPENEKHGSEFKNKCIDSNKNCNVKNFKNLNEHKSFENSKHVKCIDQKERSDDVNKNLRLYMHSEDTKFKRTGCVENGFFVKVTVSEQSTNLEYWFSSFKNVFSFQFDIERCCHFSDILIISFEQKRDAEDAMKILRMQRKKMASLNKPHVFYISALKYRIVKPCDCEQKIIPDSVTNIEKNAHLALSVIANKMKEIEVSAHRRKSEEVVATERVMLETFEDSQSNFINFKRQVISKVKVTENLNTIQKLKLGFLRECNIFKRCLPIYSRKDKILESVRYYSVTVIIAETGSGKSTQLVEYLLNSSVSDNGVIICTQPRKLAAITIAQYVSGQIGSAVGKIVGYDVGMERKRSATTKVIYMTDYCLLKTYLKNKNLNDISCIIIDEAHERSLYTDLLFGILKKCLPMRPDLRVIITSATINPSIFTDYFDMGPESVIQVPGRSYPVEVIWWPENVVLGWNYVDACVEKVYQIHSNEKEGDILVFLTSPGESEEAINLLKRYLTRRNKKAELFCLHGKSDFREQMQIFQASSSAARKIIFATNVAETAVTIPGIKYVVDSGMTKGLIFDPKKNKSVLAITFINKSSAEQRKGRAGRTQSGVCYRMYSKKNYAENMVDNAVPDILKTNLQKALLKIFEFEIDPKKFDFIESPPDKTMSNAIDSLEYLGAIEDKGLTVLGRKLAKLPLEPQWAKLVLLGIEAGIGYETIIISSLVSEAGKLFIRNEDNRAIADERKKRFCHVGGDLCTYLEVYKRWKEVDISHRFEWCVENYISSKALNAAAKTVQEIICSLRNDLSIYVSKRYNTSVFKQHYERILFDSFSENLCVSSGHPKLGYLSPFLPESFYIHPSSTLSYLGKDIPEYLVYSTLMETSRNYLFDITPISEEIIKLSNQAGTFKIPINSLKCLEIPPKMMGPFGESVLIRYILGKQGCKIKDLELKLKDMTNSRNIQIDVAVDKGLITVYVGLRHHEKVGNEINQIIDKALDDMLREEDVIKLAKTSVHYALGAGGIISDIIMPGEFRELVISSIPPKRKCKEMEDLLESYGSLQTVDHHTTSKQQVQICATYKKVCDAMKAFSDLSKMNSIGVTPKPYLPNVGDKTLPLYMLNISWCRRPCTGRGSVEFFTEEDLIIASGNLTHLSFYLDDKYILFTPSEQNNRKLDMRNLPKSADENSIRNNVRKHLPDDMRIKTITVERTMSRVATDNDIKDVKKEVTQLLSRFIPSNKVVIDVKNPNRTDHVWEVSVYFESFDDGESAFKKLSNNETINSYPLLVSKVLKFSFNCKREVYEAVSDQIIPFLRERKVRFNEKYNIKVSDTYVTVELICGTIEDLTKARQAVMHLLRGENMDFIGKPKCHFLFSQGYAERIKEIEKSTNTFINPNTIRKTITIYGSVQNCKKAMEKIYSIASDSNLSNTRVFNLNDSSIPSGFLKTIYMKYGYLLHGLIDAYELTVAEIETSRGIMILRGSKSGIKEAEKALEKICEDLYNSRSSKEKPNNSEEICPICLDPVSYAFHRLEHCGHAYCRECLLLQIESKSIPLICIKQNCEKLIILEDIKRIISFGGDHLKKSFSAAALQHHVSSNIGKISYCPTPDCQQIYRVTKQGSEYKCPGCKNSICTHCQTAYHYGMSCDMFKNCQKDEDYSLKAWVKEKESERKYCPSCKVVIEKFDGCNHMECLNCKVHLCWLCLKVFQTGQLVYDHIPYCLKNQS